MKGFCNRFSGTLILLAVLLLVSGINMCLHGTFGQFLIGGTMIVAAVSAVKGLKSPDQSKAKVGWIITWFGAPTDVVVSSMTLLLDWLPISIIGFIEVNLNLEPNNYEATKEIRFEEEGYLVAKATMGIRPISTDGLKLHQYVASGGKENVFKQINGLITAWLQWFVTTERWEYKGVSHKITYQWMESHGLDVGEHIKARISGDVGRDEENGENSHLDDIRNLGVEIENFVITFSAPEPVVNARNERMSQRAKAAARLEANKGMNEQLKTRAELKRGQGAKPDDRDQVEILNENLLADGKLTGVVTNGRTVTLAQP